jgi:hypothetical protein
MQQTKSTQHTVFAFLFFGLIACNTNDPNKVKNLPTVKEPVEAIQALHFSSAGGDMGYSLSFQISSDSTIYRLNNDMDSSKRKLVNEKTDAAFWASLTTDLNLDSLAKIKNGEMRQPYDGVDAWMHIKTNKREIEFMNPEADTLHYPSAEKLMRTINEALRKYRE